VLRAIDTARSRGLKLGALLELSRKLAKEHGLSFAPQAAEDAAVWRRDLLSHHILRLAFCNSEEKRRWFVQNEATLFQARLDKQTPEQVSDFMARHGLSFAPVPDEERMRFAHELRQVFLAVGATGRRSGGEADVGAAAAAMAGIALEGGGGGGAGAGAGAAAGAAAGAGGGRGGGGGGGGAEEDAVDFQSLRFFKVVFSQAADLVKRRQVFMAGGFAYVPHQRMLSIVENRFRVYLAYATAMANKCVVRGARGKAERASARARARGSALEGAHASAPRCGRP